MLGRCCSASRAPRPSVCAPRPFVSAAAAACPQQQHQQLRPCSGAQHRPATAIVVAAAGRGGGGRGSSAGRSSSTAGRGRGMSAAGGVNAKQLNSSINGCLNAEALMQLVEQHAASFDFIHASTALTRAAKLMEAPLSADEEECIAKLTRAAGRQIEECGAWALANMAWALAKLNYKDTAFMQRLVRQAGVQLLRFDAQNTSNTLWALARLGYVDKAFTAKLLAHAHKVKEDFNSQEVANTLLSMAKLQHVAEDRQLVQDLLEHAQPQLPDFIEQQLANTAWALATLRHYDHGFMEQLLQQASGKLPGSEAQTISNTLWALATLNHNDTEYVNGAIRVLLHKADSLNKQDICNTLWALSMLRHDATAVVMPLIAAASTHFKAVEPSLGRIVMDTELQLRQVQVYLVAMEGAGHVSKQLQASSQYQQLRRACRAAFAQRAIQLRNSPHPFNMALLPAVRQLPGCSDVQVVQVTGDQDVYMNVGLTLPCGTKVAVEVVSRTACMANAPDKVSGPILWKHKQLAARGYKVVVVKEADWLELGPEMQQMYLRILFKQAGVVLPASSSVAGAA